MKRRDILQASAAGVGGAVAPWAFAQTGANLKPGKPYAGTEGPERLYWFDADGGQRIRAADQASPAR